jgi:hypothetical protein
VKYYIKTYSEIRNHTTLPVSVFLLVLTYSLLLFLLFLLLPHLENMASVKRFVSLQFLNVRQSVRLPGRGISPSQGRCLTQTRNKHRQTFMPSVGFEPTIPVFERKKTFHALACADNVIGFVISVLTLFYLFQFTNKSTCALSIFLRYVPIIAMRIQHFTLAMMLCCTVYLVLGCSPLHSSDRV